MGNRQWKGGYMQWNRAEVIGRWFGIDPAEARLTSRMPGPLPAELRGMLPKAGQIVLICGPSGSGKSTLLRRLRWRMRKRIELDRIALPRRPVIELFGRMKLEDALALLSRFGLAEAHIYLLPPQKLSAGQQWRLRLALRWPRGKGAAARASSAMNSPIRSMRSPRRWSNTC